jgi:glycosyltransferase involved in cell wall biosynthesis
MAKPRLCLIFESIGFTSGIAKVAYQDVTLALRAGYEVTVVAQHLDPSLHGAVEWLRLYVPPRLFLLKWATANHFMKKALGERRFDVIHSHQPQGAAMANVFTCHFLTRVAYERNCLETGKSISARIVRAQQQGVLHLEDRCYRQLAPSTQVVFCSDLLREEFQRLYGPPPRQVTIQNACMPAAAIALDARRSAKRHYFGQDPPSPVVGFLGGTDERKGYPAMIRALRQDPSIYALIGGPGTQNGDVTEFDNRVRRVGLVRDIDQFYAACDVIAVPSVFDPCPMVVLEAVARDIPVIATGGVGNLAEILRCDAGLEWNPAYSLGNLIQEIQRRRDAFVQGACRMAHELTEARRAEKMLAVYESALGQASPRLEPLAVAS